MDGYCGVDDLISVGIGQSHTNVNPKISEAPLR
jgi:hypothetical protein